MLIPQLFLQVALIFTKKKLYKNGVSELDINALEKRLKKAKREKPKSVQLYNQIGNFWRIKGDTRLSIECFRRALAVSPYNAEVKSTCTMSICRSEIYMYSCLSMQYTRYRKIILIIPHYLIL